MAIRIKNKWSKTAKGKKSADDIASALSYISWKIALDRARQLHGDDYEYNSDHQRVTVIVEYMSFQIHIIDRLLYLSSSSDENRLSIMNALGSQSARIMQDNCEDLFGQGDYKKGYINTLNLRSTEYSEYSFGKKENNYSIYRHLAKKIQDAMGLSQTNKWIMDQIVDIDAKDICKKIIETFESITKE
ncbi:MAG: hypothetical protein CMD88_05325 [Gammaproteobacteria bacterium]|nr:hypothetical protein [Gammaproteobacteria bacterium]|tara:strand:+ start:949 stop:1512 length:564 start_codon:yes stop_codon:yes gene_type:complete